MDVFFVMKVFAKNNMLLKMSKHHEEQVHAKYKSIFIRGRTMLPSTSS